MDQGSIIRSLPPERWREYKELRLHALFDCPFAFQEDFNIAKNLPDDTWQEWLATRNIFFYEKDGKLVGMAGFFRKEGPKAAHVVHIVGVYVRSEMRGQGIASKLFEAIEAAARDMGGVKKLTLGAAATQIPALSLYKKSGFEVIGCRKEQICVNNTYFDQYLLEKFL